MPYSVNLIRRLDAVDVELRELLLSILEEIERNREESVTKREFQDLHDIVKELGHTVQELAEAQKRTEIKVEELAVAQKETQEEVKLLTHELRLTRRELGGLSLSVSYGFENEAYRMLPELLKSQYGIEMTDRFVRVDIGEKEINLFGHGRRNGKNVVIVGEAKLRLDERREKKHGESTFDELEEKVGAVRAQEGDVEIVRLLMTHYATKGFLRKAQERGVIVVQSFEW